MGSNIVGKDVGEFLLYEEEEEEVEVLEQTSRFLKVD